MPNKPELTRAITDAPCDPIMRLHDYYFQSCDVMHKYAMKKMEYMSPRKRKSTNQIVEFQSFLHVWLSMLHVVSEGFQNKKLHRYFNTISYASEETNIYWSSIHHQIGQLGNYLRIYRNKSFHYQDNEQVIIDSRSDFLQNHLDRDAINWANDLHREMRSFFSSYRSDAWVNAVLTSKDKHQA